MARFDHPVDDLHDIGIRCDILDRGIHHLLDSQSLEPVYIGLELLYPDLDAVSLHADFLDKEYIYVLEYLIPFQMIAHLMAMDMGLSTIHARNDGASSQLETHVN